MNHSFLLDTNQDLLYFVSVDGRSFYSTDNDREIPQIGPGVASTRASASVGSGSWDIERKDRVVLIKRPSAPEQS